MCCLDSGIVHFSDHTQLKLVNIFFVFIFALPTKQNCFLSFSVFLVFFFPTRVNFRKCEENEMAEGYCL